MTDYAITTEHLAKHYSRVRAVDGLDLRVPRGSIYGFLGRNGAGKTTTIRMLMGLASPTRGTASVLGLHWPQDRLAILQRVGYLSEKKLLFEAMTGRDLVRFNKPYFSHWSDELATRYAQRLEVPMDRAFRKLSQGNRTKLCLLLALAQGAELLVLDEPTSGLDPVVMDELLRVLIDDYAGVGHTIFLSSHNLAEVEKVADWVGIIDQGKLLLEAPLEEIRADFRRITASGNDLPGERTEQIISVAASGSMREYIVRYDSEQFVVGLRQQGATIINVSPLNLGQVFLQLVKKEEPCISGNIGATPAVASSSI
ncbi:MAG TPA: ABC transporter ATP-binding protein [Candidatus Acidoferrales bacterium]|nr:ABC transporter ATP-binding protein [Candidatus Acidoferrales bacterium]